MKRTVKASFFMSFIFIGMLVQPAFSQTLKDFFNSSETSALYLGIDFTRAKLIDDATANEMDIRDRQFAGINDLIVTETKKFDMNSAFHKSNIDHDLGLVAKRNEKADAEKIKSTSTSDFHRLKEDDITALVKGFDFGDKKGIGLLFVMEAMSKSGKAAAIWVTFIDMKTKKVLLTERIECKTKMAIGFRNYWASSVKSLLDEIEDRKYKEWKNKNQ
jgi:glycosyltransferase involved in cell wall biosynthesis